MPPETTRLGTCYYPEHWPEEIWAQDAARMAAMGLSRVRIGEFAWSRIEPAPSRFDWGWLDRAVATLHNAGLGIIMGTPTACPPRWLVNAMPDMVPVDRHGRPRGFGSRRHYCFSHAGYRAEAARITRTVAERYGTHPGIIGWQTDNEYGCHDTAVSYSSAARDGFRRWCAGHYQDIAALNAAWGSIFWSMDYGSFDDIDLPNLTVTEANPAHWLAFRRFASDEVVAFNRAQTDIIRAASPGRWITHNVMGFFTQFDHHALARDLDIVTWDSYPLGFLEQFSFSTEGKAAYARQGHPDIAAFHHDLYRGCSPTGRWGVMEQQPGPVNWARYNPAPLPGMVRLWTLEAAAHGAELVSFFRWRQLPFGQEQMHAGLLRPDNVEAPAADEIRAAASELAALGPLGEPVKEVALLFDYAADWVTEIQPQGQGFRALWTAFAWYGALRRAGLNVDIVPADATLEGYAAVVAPCLPILDEALVERLAGFAGPVLIGARSGSKSAEFRIPDELAPGPLQSHIAVKVVRVESRRSGNSGSALWDGWLEHVESRLEPEIRDEAGHGIVWRNGRVRYLAVAPTDALLDRLVDMLAVEGALETMILPEGVRLRRTARHLFAFNYAAEPQTLADGESLPPAGARVWLLSPEEDRG